MSKKLETMLAWGLFAAVYVLILAIVVAPDLFEPADTTTTLAQAEVTTTLATHRLPTPPASLPGAPQ